MPNGLNYHEEELGHMQQERNKAREERDELRKLILRIAIRTNSSVCDSFGEDIMNEIYKIHNIWAETYYPNGVP